MSAAALRGLHVRGDPLSGSGASRGSADIVICARVDVHLRGGTTEEALERPARTATPAPTASTRSA
jgi:2-methylisocitrate lyase-like PEP mutase family enzyme